MLLIYRSMLFYLYDRQCAPAFSAMCSQAPKTAMGIAVFRMILKVLFIFLNTFKYNMIIASGG